MARQLRRRTAASKDDYEPVDDVHTDEEEESPRGRRRGASRSRKEEPEEEKPRGKRSAGRKSAEGGRRKQSSGWDAYEKAKAETSSDFAPEFQKDMSEDERLFKFVDEEPVAVYKQHWIERGKGKKKSFTCTDDGECPLCEDAGDKPSSKAVFNVIDLSGDEPEVKMWTVGVKVANNIKALAGSKKTSPLNREDLYFAVNRTGGTGSWQTNVVAVKARDLEDDWDIRPLTDAELDGLEADAFEYDDVVEDTSVKTLEEIADEILEG